MNTDPFTFSFPCAPDWTQTQAEQEEALAHRMDRLARLKQELANLRERKEALAFALEYSTISEAEFDNNNASLNERLEACEAEVKGMNL